jgi:mRNA interferase HigB
MRVLALSALREFWKIEHQAEEPMRDFYQKLSRVQPANLAELKLTFPSVDLVGKCYVFNVGGNKYRVIARIHFNRQMAFIRFVLTHREYDRDKWKSEC